MKITFLWFLLRNSQVCASEEWLSLLVASRNWIGYYKGKFSCDICSVSSSFIPIIYVSKNGFLRGLVGRVFILLLVSYQSVCVGFWNHKILRILYHSKEAERNFGNLAKSFMEEMHQQWAKEDKTKLNGQNIESGRPKTQIVAQW